jgi:hypothetical protein
MGRRKTKADRLAGFLEELTVEELDEQLMKLGRAWTRVYMNRQLRAKEEGTTTPPPAPPKVGEGTQAENDTKTVGEHEPPDGANGNLATLKSLIQCYRNDSRSPFLKARFRTRETYKSLINRIDADYGPQKLVDLKAQDIKRFHEIWTERGEAIAHSLITMLRMLFGFGATELGDAECERLSVVMHKMRFEKSKRRSPALTPDHVRLIVTTAHEKGLDSIALAQALQFDCGLSQKDVIGEWVPVSEPGPPSDIINDELKWLYGIRWSEIDKDLVLRHVPSIGGDLIELRLSESPLVMAEFDRIRAKLGKLPPGGPVVVSEHNNLPYSSFEFRRKWRAVADAAGVPKAVKNRTSRAGDKGSVQGYGVGTA